MRFGNRYSLYVMRVTIKLTCDGGPIVDGGRMAAQAAALAAPLGQRVAVAGHVGAGFVDRIIAGVGAGDGRIEDNVNRSVQVFGSGGQRVGSG